MLYTIFRVSSRLEHLGFVLIAGIDVFHLHPYLYGVSVMLLCSGGLALWRDCRDWHEDGPPPPPIKIPLPKVPLPRLRGKGSNEEGEQ